MTWSDKMYLINILAVVALGILIVLKITYTHTHLVMKREKEVFLLKSVKATDVNFSHSCPYMIQKVYKLWFRFVFSKSSKRIKAISFKVLMPPLLAYLLPKVPPVLTSFQIFSELITRQWLSFADSKLILAALSPCRTNCDVPIGTILCDINWGFSAFIIPFTIL